MKPIPNPITVNTGEQEKVSKTIDDFFTETKRFTEKHYDVQKLEWQIKSGEIAYRPELVTPDRVTYLSYKDTILASVFETRTESNHVRYTFFRNLKGLKDYLKGFKDYI